MQMDGIHSTKFTVCENGEQLLSIPVAQSLLSTVGLAGFLVAAVVVVAVGKSSLLLSSLLVKDLRTYME